MAIALDEDVLVAVLERGSGRREDPANGIAIQSEAIALRSRRYIDPLLQQVLLGHPFKHVGVEIVGQEALSAVELAQHNASDRSALRVRHGIAQNATPALRLARNRRDLCFVAQALQSFPVASWPLGRNRRQDYCAIFGLEPA